MLWGVYRPRMDEVLFSLLAGSVSIKSIEKRLTKIGMENLQCYFAGYIINLFRIFFSAAFPISFLRWLTIKTIKQSH